MRTASPSSLTSSHMVLLPYLKNRHGIDLRLWFCLWLLIIWSSDAMLMPDRLHTNSRYFTQDGMLPPLALSSAVVHPYSNQTDSIISFSPLSLPSNYYHGTSIPVTYTNNPKSVYHWLSENLPSKGCILGFDVESRPVRRKKRLSSFDHASTVQLATPSSCLVVHLVRRSGRHSHACAPLLKAVLCDEQFVKAGCALDEDMMALHDLWGGLEARSRLDLGYLGSRTRKACRRGLQFLSNRILGVDLPKSKKMTMSDWSLVPLTKNQVVYSARDAWAGAAITTKLAKYDPGTFGLEALVRSLQDSEPSISELINRRRRRRRAQRDLERLIAPYRGSPREVPRHVKVQARYLREVIKDPIIDFHLALDSDHIDLDFE